MAAPSASINSTPVAADAGTATPCTTVASQTTASVVESTGGASQVGVASLLPICLMSLLLCVL
jgi:hypothetical protein